MNKGACSPNANLPTANFPTEAANDKPHTNPIFFDSMPVNHPELECDQVT